MSMRKWICGMLGFLFLCLCLPAASGCSPLAGLVISEVVADNRSSYLDPELDAPDWIELHNTGNTTVRLLDYILTDNADTPDMACILPDISIPAGGYCILPCDSVAYTTANAFCLPFGISKNGEALYLLDPSGQLVFELTVPALGEDVSYARRGDGSYGYCLRPTPAAANDSPIVDELPQTAGEQERSDVALRISEIVSSNRQAEPYACCDWIELYNPTGTDIDVGGFFLSDDETDPRKAVLPALLVPAQGYAVIACSKTVSGAAFPTAALNISSSGETLWLFDAYGHLIDLAAVPALQENISWALGGDGQFGYCGVPTPGAANANVRADSAAADMGADEPVRISEALFDNAYSAIDEYGDHSDWVELYNHGSQPVSLLGYYLSDRFDDPAKWAFPDVTIAPGAYLIVFLSGRASTATELHASFSVSDTDDGCILYRAETFAADRIPVAADWKENVSIGRAADGSLVYYAYPTPRFPNARAVSDPGELAAYPADSIHISEVSASGGGDFIELFNPTQTDLDLTGWYLSDRKDDPTRYRIDGVTVRAGAYAVIDADADAATADVAAFGISAGGETILLTDPDGLVRDVFATGALSGGMTSGRVRGEPTVGRAFFASATRGEENSAAYTVGRTGAPLFSDLTLYHAEPFSLSLSFADPDAVIRYTLDGSEPGGDSAVYREPIAITGNMTVRAVAALDGRQAIAVQTAHYLLGAAHTLPVVCIALEPEHWKLLQDVPYNEKGLEERRAHLTYFEADGTLGTAFYAGVKPRGNASLSYPQKSLSVHLRQSLGQDDVTYPFWDNGGTYATLVLRNASQDIGGARLRDSFANRAVAGMQLDHAQTRPVVVYVNGAYYGVMDLNEGMNQDYLVTHLGVDPDTVNIVARNQSASHGSADDYLRVRQYARAADLSNDAAMAELSQWVDVPCVTDYLIAQTFFGNYDIHNQNCWSTNDYTVRWRPYLYDGDRCLAQASVSTNMFSMYFDSEGVVHNRIGDRVNMDIYCALRKSPAWCDTFLDRYAELLCGNFSVETLTALLDGMADELRPEMAAHIALYGLPVSVAAWERSVSDMRGYIAERHAVIQTHLQQEFGVSAADWDALMRQHGG